MDKFINSVIRRMGAVAILKREIVSSYLNLYRIAFITKDGKYRYLEIFYNDTSIFYDRSLLLIGEGYEMSESDHIRRQVMSFDSQKELFKYYDSRNLDKRSLDLYFVNYTNNLLEQLNSIKLNNLLVKSVTIYTTPCIMIIVYYNVGGIRHKPLKLFIDEPLMDYESDKPEEKYLKGRIREIIGGNVIEHI